MNVERSGRTLLAVLRWQGIGARTFFSAKQPKSLSSEKLISKEQKFSANNYTPIPVVIARGEGCHVWDPEGKCYLDFLGGFAALNTGHSHPKILKVLREQAGILAHTSRAFHNNVYPEFAEQICSIFGYDKVIPMNTGVEAGETAVKIARRWGYRLKKIPQGKALVVFPEGNFWGRTTAAISTSTSPVMFEDFGPYMPGFGLVPYNDVAALEDVLKNPNVCAYFCESIQGEAGVIIPCPGYLRAVKKICEDNNVLWIGDEIQTGLGRTGELLACDHEKVRPDLLLLGKGLAGAFTPVSAVLGNQTVMKVMTPGSHGSTFGGNPLGCKLALTTLQVIQEEGLIDNARRMGDKFRSLLECSLPKEVVMDVRGRGLMIAITISSEYATGWDFAVRLKDYGLLAKNTNECHVRFTPPLTVTEEEIKRAAEIIYKVAQEFRGCKV